MPEGPEVRTFTDILNEQLTGKYLMGISWDQNSKYKNGLSNYDSLAIYFPLLIEIVACKGKQIFIILLHTNGTRFYLNSTLGMEGKWCFQQGSHSNLWLTIGTMNKVSSNSSNQVVLSNSTDQPNSSNSSDQMVCVPQFNIYFDDSRHFGNFTILNQQQCQAKVDELGYDVIADEITFEQFKSLITRSRLKNMEICKFLMEQKYLCGIGNYLKAEILYQSKINPQRKLQSLTLNDIIMLYQSCLDIPRRAYQARGLTIRSYQDPYGKKGSFDTCVYGKTTDPYGNPVTKAEYTDGRSTHWVPAIQV